jgi:TonB family protein
MKHLPVALALLALTVLPSAGQEASSETRIQIKKMEVPRYLPLAQQAGISGDVTLHLTVNKSGDVTAVDIISAHPKNWGEGFASMAIEAAKRSQFSCASCTSDTFEHTVTYQFDFPPIPANACTLQPPPPIPPSKVDSVSHVTVRPKAWPCVQI